MCEPLRHQPDQSAAVELETIEIPDAHGRPMVRARVPLIDRRCESPLHSVASMQARVGSWREEAAAFQRREIPTAHFRVDASYYDPHGRREHDDLRRTVVAAIEEGYAGGIAINADGELSGRLALPDLITSTVDLAALEGDWRGWLAAAGLEDEYGDELARAVDELRQQTYGDFLWRLDALSTFEPSAALVHGVVVGDDPGMACAFALWNVTGDRRYWEPVR